MEQESISLKWFLLGDPPNKALSECAAAALGTLQGGLPDIGTIDWQALSTDIAQELEEMFDIRITDVLASAWEDYQELAESADPTKHPANEMISLPIVDHRIETTLKPGLDIVIGARPPIRIAFEITCELEFKGFVLKIQDAAIRALGIGSCRAKGIVKCDGIALIRRETKQLNLPGRITLPSGIPLRRSRQALPCSANDCRTEPRFVPRITDGADTDLLSVMPI